MNISSVIVAINKLTLKPILEKISRIEGCEVPLFVKDKLIVTIEAPNSESEVSKLKEIESIDGVISARMAYAYSEEELDAVRQKIELAGDSPEWLNEDNIDVKDIPYSGKLKL